MKTSTKLSLAMLSIVMVFGCTAITDFEMDDDTDTGTGTDTGTDTNDGPYSLDGALGDPVEVTLQGDGTAVISLELDLPLPEADGGDSELEAMLGDTILMAVINDDTSATFNLSEGTMVDDTPDSSGEYRVELSSDRQTLDVIFFNDLNGSALSAGGDYSVLIDVRENSQSFEVGSFTREVVIS